MSRNPSRRTLRGAIARVAVGLLVPAALLAWLWPIGTGGMMPVGGDVTQFFIGLMAFLGDSLRAGRLPVWNDLWGYGFPGLAESQMGVFYPPHAVLYGQFETETAYVISMVLHTVWGGLGAFWASRRMGISGVGSALAGFTWSACGFFMIHLAHAWSYTTGAWMPWAVGLTWTLLAPGARPSRWGPLLLSLVLVLQVLPGHFQLAFETLVVLLLMMVWAVAEHWGADLGARRRGSGRAVGAGAFWRKAGTVVAAMAAIFPLAAIQFWPTERLARLARVRSDFGYLSDFPTTPLHLVNFVAPGLFHRSPTWRPLVWDPLHAMPEECLTYVGLVPLFLAVMAAWRGFRRDPAVRLLTIVALATLILSLGPYAPGFRDLIRLPGFSFFRAPARWSLVTTLALAMLAGKGFDRWPEWPRPGRALRWCVGLAVFWIVAVLGVVELAVLCTEPAPGAARSLTGTSSPRWPAVAARFQAAFRLLPWSGETSLLTKPPTFVEVMASARRPVDPYVPADLQAGMVLKHPVPEKVFVNWRGRIYLEELGETAVLLVLIWLIAGLHQGGRTRAARAALVVISFADLWLLGRHRLIDVAPLEPLASQSPVLARLAREPRGTRIADPLRNMPMRVGLAPISYYRTLNLPAVEGLTMAAQGPMGVPRFEAVARSALRITGTSLRLFEPLELRINDFLGRKVPETETIEDPALARWRYGSKWVDEQDEWVNRFAIWRAPDPPVRAWFLPRNCGYDESTLEGWPEDFEDLLTLFGRAQPLRAESPRPEEWTIPVWTDEPGWVILSQLHVPQWKARWLGMEGQPDFEMPIEPAFRRGDEPGGWQRVEIPGEGLWSLRLNYDAHYVAEGAAISTIAWTAWITVALVLMLRALAGRFRTRPIPGGT